MHPTELYPTLIAVAKRHPPSAVVPVAFEQRIMAHLRGLPPRDPWVDWTRALWRAALSSAVITAVFSAWIVTSSRFEEAGRSLGGDLERTVYAAVEVAAEAW